MGRTGETLTFDEIVEINRLLIQEFGGIYIEGNRNLHNPGTLEYALEAIQGSLFGVELHPTLAGKAAALGWAIIAGHVFHDGNKRTGMAVVQQFLIVNGYDLRVATAEVDQDVIRAALDTATAMMDADSFAVWIEERMIPLQDE
jgi:death-on-curing protein